MMIPFLILAACAMGVAATVQGATNGVLSSRIGIGLAILMNSAIATVGCVAFWFLVPKPANPSSFSSIPGYLWLGGFYGLVITAVAAFAFPRLGAGPTTAIMVCSQLLMALVLDQFGILAEQIPVTPPRMIGVVLLIAGTLLVLWPKLRV